MKKHIMRNIIVVLLAALSVVPIAAQEAYPTNTITVTGTGTASGAPDIANLEIGVETNDPDVRVAFANTNATINAIITAMVDAGVAAEDVRTIGLNVFQDRQPIELAMMSPETNAGDVEPVYRVSNQVRVTIRNIDIVGDVIGAAVEAGANNIFGLNFGIDDRAALESEARAGAIADAQERANELAELIGANLGTVIVVNEVSGGFSPFDAFNMSISRQEGIGGGASIEPGQLTISTQVQVTYTITR